MDEFLFLARNATSLREKTAGLNFSKLKSGLQAAKGLLGKKPPVPEPIIPHPTGYSPVGGVPHVPSMPHPPATPVSHTTEQLDDMLHIPKPATPTPMPPRFEPWRTVAPVADDALDPTQAAHLPAGPVWDDITRRSMRLHHEPIPMSLPPSPPVKPPSTYKHPGWEGKDVPWEDGDGLPLGKISSDSFVKLASKAKTLRRGK